MKPEMVVRRIVYRMGYRYRLHSTSLPGKPDIVLNRLQKIIDVRGCFWHQHGECIDSHIPRSRLDYWVPKLQRNQKRDGENLEKLKSFGWNVLIVWECEVKDLKRLTRRVRDFLSS